MGTSIDSSAELSVLLAGLGLAPASGPASGAATPPRGAPGSSLGGSYDAGSTLSPLSFKGDAPDALNESCEWGCTACWLHFKAQSSVFQEAVSRDTARAKIASRSIPGCCSDLIACVGLRSAACTFALADTLALNLMPLFSPPRDGHPEQPGYGRVHGCTHVGGGTGGAAAQAALRTRTDPSAAAVQAARRVPTCDAAGTCTVVLNH